MNVAAVCETKHLQLTRPKPAYGVQGLAVGIVGPGSECDISSRGFSVLRLLSKSPKKGLKNDYKYDIKFRLCTP